jgi:nitrous oxidase accessory protein
MRRIKILGMVVLFSLSLCLSSVRGLITKEPVTFYSGIIRVDNEGDGDYTTIIEALNNANPGDTIEVYSGTYFERGINVEKEGITFQGVSYELGSGNDTGIPFIDGEGKDGVFQFDAKNITIDNFHIENGGGTAAYTILTLTDKSNGCIISNNYLNHSISALIWIKGSNNKIINNNVNHSVTHSGIGLRSPCSNCIVSGNNISYVEDGIKLWDSNHNTVTGNRVNNCSRFGIETSSSSHVEGNSIEDNYIGIFMYGGFNNHIKNNNFINNEIDVKFIFDLPFILSIITNRFNGNYWDDWIGFGPKLIHGVLLFIPWVEIDWHPAKEPYEI